MHDYEQLAAEAHRLLDRFLTLVFEQSVPTSEQVAAALEMPEAPTPRGPTPPEGIKTNKDVVRWFMTEFPAWTDLQIVEATGLHPKQVARERNRYEVEMDPRRSLTYTDLAEEVLATAGERGIHITELTHECGLTPDKQNSFQSGLNRTSRDGGPVERIEDRRGWYRIRTAPVTQEESGEKPAVPTPVLSPTSFRK
mgnify:CR=1 FL=1